MIMGMNAKELFKLLKENLIGDPQLELAKFELIQRCETIEDLQNASNFVMRDAPKNRCLLKLEEITELIKEVIINNAPCFSLPRIYGIQQQALYIKERLKTIN